MFQVMCLQGEGLFTTGACSEPEIMHITLTRELPTMPQLADLATMLRGLLVKKQPERITAAQALHCSWIAAPHHHRAAAAHSARPVTEDRGGPACATHAAVSTSYVRG